MPNLDFQPEILSQQESRRIASKQVLSFISLPFLEAGPQAFSLTGAGPAPSKAFFSIGELPEAALEGEPSFNWRNRDIYDVDGRLLFRDQIINLSSEGELRVRTAASPFLRTPVWSVKAGPTLNLEDLARKAMEALWAHPTLVPLPGDVLPPRLVAYSYPKLGILCCRKANPSERFVMDIGDLSIIPLDASSRQEDPDLVNTVWSPYDSVVSATTGLIRSLWEHKMDLLDSQPEAGGGNLPEAVIEAEGSIQEELTTNPELRLVGQQTNVFCAVATAKMILEHHHFNHTQEQIAYVMQTGEFGTLPNNQVAGIPGLTGGTFIGISDFSPSFDEAKIEIRQNRPFKSGISGHARACGGFRVENGGKNLLYIYDPWPPNQGDIYYEDWDAVRHTNHMYVRPALFS